jgi:succinyl-diaminopimelate desuccinylase
VNAPIAIERDVLMRHAAFDEDALTSQLRRLIQARSVNPDDGEHEVAAEVSRALAAIDCEVHRVESLPGRDSVAAVINGRASGPRLVLNGHMDTVGVDDAAAWKADPFAGETIDGYVYGRGACDMKGGLAVMLAVGAAIAQVRDALAGQLILHFAIGEERAEPGTASLLNAGFGGDMGIVVEPSRLAVSIAQRGVAFYDVTIHGVACHAGFPTAGRNPLAHLPAVLDVLSAYDEEISTRQHPLLPPPTSTPTIVRAGSQPNSVPGECSITIDRRLLPGEDPEEELAALRARLAYLPEVDIALREHYFRPAEVSADSAVVRLLSSSSAHIAGRSPELVGAPYATDCSVLISRGSMEAVVFGPGDPSECHCVNERMSQKQLRDGALILANAVVDFLS